MDLRNEIKKGKFYLWAGLVYLFLWILTDLANYPDTFFEHAVNNTWRACYIVLVNFILFEYALPFVTRKRKTVLYNILYAIPVFVVYVMLYSWGLYAWRLAGIELHIYTPLKIFNTVEDGVTEQLSYSLISFFYFAVIRHIYNYIKLRQSAQQLRIEKQEAELNYLKSQTNPHFLFNTLNNIYSLARDKSELAPESILRLSKILRYILYEAGSEYIAVEQELKIISDYIELEKLRYDDSLLINFNYDVEDMKQSLPPLLLIPLVENAFKHGVSETRNRPFIDVHLSLNNRQLNFTVKNSAERSAGEPETVRENIGLSNLRRQLQLLYKDFSLSAQHDESNFTSILKINLSSHV